MLRLGFDIGGMSIRACLLDDQNMRIVAQKAEPFPIGQGEDALISQLKRMADDISLPLGLSPEMHRSVGVGIPGTVHRATGVLLSACNLHLNGMPIVQRMRKCFPNAHVAVANDADVAALAEYYAGAFRGYDSGLLITIGTGIGSGMIVNGRLFDGGKGLGSELGHITLQQDGPMCACGNQGCAEGDEATRKEIYAKVQEIVHEDAPYNPVFYTQGAWAVKKGVQGIDYYPTLQHSLRNIHMVLE